MKEKKLLRTEFYRTRSAGTKTESINPDTPSYPATLISEASQIAEDYPSATIKSQASYRARRSSSKITLAWLLWRRS